MKISLTEFRALVGLATPFVAKRDIVPILRHLVFRGKQILACDGGSSGVQLDSPWDFGRGFTLLAERLTRLLAATEGLVEEISLVPGDGRVKASGGGFEAEFASLKVEEYPFPALPDRRKAQPVPTDWGKVVGDTLFSVSQDETKPALRGVRAEGRWVRSSDNYRITRIRQSKPVDVFLSDLLASRLGSALSLVSQLAVTPSVAAVYFPGGVAFGQLLNAEFPKVDELFTRCGKALAEDKTMIEIRAEDVSPVAMALRRVLLFAEDDLLTRLRVIVKPGFVEFATPQGGLEQAKERVPVEIRGPGVKNGLVFQVNGKMFLEAWEHCPRVAVAQPSDLPLYFQSTDKIFEHLLMRLAD